MNAAQDKSALSSFFRVLLQDVGFSLRQLRKSPGFAAVVIGSLALGIGASVAVFSVVRAVLLDPYPYKDANRMVHVELKQKNTDRNNLLYVTSTEFHDLQKLASVDDVFLMDDRTQALTGDALPVSVSAGYYSSNLFTYMGVPPILGREFTPSDAPGGNASPVAVLSYLFWKKQYGGRLDILGKTIELDHMPYTVIGVASPRFTWGDSDVYMPGNFKADPHYYMNAFLKLKPGVVVRAGRRRVAAAGRPLRKAGPDQLPPKRQGSDQDLERRGHARLRGAAAYALRGCPLAADDRLRQRLDSHARARNGPPARVCDTLLDRRHPVAHGAATAHRVLHAFVAGRCGGRAGCL